MHSIQASPSVGLARCLAPCPLSAAQNMALDDLLLDEKGWFIRLTRWDRPAVTLGKFQSWPTDENNGLPPLHPFGENPSASTSLPAVRRVTGGGAIVHGEDLTIAVAGDCPSRVFPQRNPESVATSFSKILASLFAHPASSRGGIDRESSMQKIADCFARQSPSDVIVDSHQGPIKAGGIALAFRNHRVLIEASLRRELLAAAVENDLEILTQLTKALGLEPQPWEQDRAILDGSWADEISKRVEVRFGNPDWNRR